MRYFFERIELSRRPGLYVFGALMAIVRAKVFVGENLGNPWFFSSKISYVTCHGIKLSNRVVSL